MVERNNLVDIWLPGNSKKAEREMKECIVRFLFLIPLHLYCAYE
jgi:hypothetical protein